MLQYSCILGQRRLRAEMKTWDRYTPVPHAELIKKSFVHLSFASKFPKSQKLLSVMTKISDIVMSEIFSYLYPLLAIPLVLMIAHLKAAAQSLPHKPLPANVRRFHSDAHHRP